MMTRPDSALELLQAHAAVVKGASEKEKAMYNLLCAEAKIKLLIPLEADSVAMSLVDYFKEEGTPEQRMRACYVAGCHYLDVNLLPLAQQWFFAAMQEKDKVAKSRANQSRIARIYGQFVELYMEQADIRLVAKKYEEAEQAAEEAGDSYLKARLMLRKLDYYRMKEQPDSILKYCGPCMDMLRQFDDTEGVFSAMLGRCGAYMDKGMLEKAAKDLRYIEDSLQLVDENYYLKGATEPNSTSYYSYKGMYYKYVGKLDSSIVFYRRAYNAPHLVYKEGGALALAQLYQLMHQNDSSVKYYATYTRYSFLLDSMKKADMLQQQEVAFERERTYKKMQQVKAENAANVRKWRTTVIGAVVAVTLLLVLLRQYRRRSRIRYDELLDRYDQVCRNIADVQDQLATEKAKGEAADALVAKLEGKLTESVGLKKQFEDENPDIESYKLRTLRMAGTDEAQAIKCCLRTDTPVAKELLTALQQAVRREMPKLNDFLFNPQYALSDKQINVCCLICSSFTPSEMSRILCTAPQNISSIRYRLGKKLFTDCKNTHDFDIRLLHLADSL